MSDYLLPELIDKILLKLPVESIIRCTAVCKSWYTTITSPSFISSHLENPQTQALLLKHYDRRNKQEHFSLLKIAEKNTTPFDFPFQAHFKNIKIVGCCRGILCLSDHNFSSLKRPLLWNPSARKYHVLPKGFLNPTWKHKRVLGVGAAHDDLKVVRLVYAHKSIGFSSPAAEVFSLKTGRWRRLIGIDVKLNVVKCMWYQVFLNGVVHWLGYHKLDDGQRRNWAVLAFRIGQEVFDEVALPCELAKENHFKLSLTSAGESLAVIKYDGYSRYDSRSCDVWLMKEYGVESSWTKCYRVLLDEGMGKVLALRNNGEALVEAFGGIGLVAFDLASGKTKHLGIHVETDSFYVGDYVESLELLQCDSQDFKDVNSEEET